MMNDKLCILTAGTGSRLGDLTKKLNKSLLPVGKTTVLSLIIKQFDPKLPIVIAVGYKSDMVKEYCRTVHHDRNITFVDVDLYEGVGSGPGYSLQCCKEFLSGSFYLITSDCLVVENIPQLNHDWIGVCDNDYSGLYATSTSDENDNVIKFQNKSKNEYEQAFIGLSYIYDYKNFWSQIENKNTSDKELEFVSAWYDPSSYETLKSVKFTWMDTGCLEGYRKTLGHFDSDSLGMNKVIDEITINENNIVCKMTPDKIKNSKRLYRSYQLSEYIPKIINKGDYSYAYEWIEGGNLYQENDIRLYIEFVQWCKDNLWNKVYEVDDMHEQCYKFYNQKTKQRLEMYFLSNTITHDTPCTINHKKCNDIETLLQSALDYDIYNGIAVGFHGDLQFQNVLHNETIKYTLIDWRESFGDAIEYGDLYYDFAKLYGGMLLNYNEIESVANTLIETNGHYTYKYVRDSSLQITKLYFEQWLVKHRYSLKKVKILTALVWLSMAPLHVKPIDKLLFIHAKELLSDIMV